MREIILLIAVVVMVGCGKKASTPQPETRVEPNAAADRQGAHKPEPTVAVKIPANAFVNTLGMPFVPVPGTEVSFCIWETRVKDYAAYAAANEGVDASWKTPEFKQEDIHPVVNVSWKDANAFCAWLTKKELAEGEIKAGQKYRLPTDAEWSVAVGLGKEKGNTPKEKDKGLKGVYPWGKEWPPPKKAGNYHESLKVDNYKYTSPVGSFAENQQGLHDLSGNVYEWCEDRVGQTSSKTVLRGGSWYSGRHPRDLMLSYRNFYSSGSRNTISGFRCVLVGE